MKAQRRKVERGPRPGEEQAEQAEQGATGPMTEAEWAEYQAQKERIRQGAQALGRQAEQDWHFGRDFVWAEIERRWLRDPEHKDKSFIRFAESLVADILGKKTSRQTIQRCMLLARSFSLEELRRHVADGIGSTVLSEIARAPGEAWDDLFELARDGHGVAEVIAARQAVEDELVAKAEEPLRWADTRHAIAKALARLEQKEARRRALAREGEDYLHQEVERLSGEQEQLRRERQALEAQRRQLEAERQQLAGEPVLAREAEIGRRTAALEKAQADLQAQRDELLREAQALSPRRAELDRREEALRAGEERLQELPKTLELQQARLSEYESYLKEQAALCETQRRDNEAEAARLQEFRRQLNSAQHKLAQESRQVLGRLVTFEDVPDGADPLFIAIEEHLDHLSELVDIAAERLEEGELPVEGGVRRVLAIGESFQGLKQALTTLIPAAGKELMAEDPERFQREYREYQAEHGGSAPAAEPAAAGPAAANATAAAPAAGGYRLPVATVVGTGDGATPQHGILALLPTLAAAVALCLNKTQVINIVGLQNSGKSSTILAIVEMLLQSLGGINQLKKALGALFMHYDQEGGPPPGIHKSRRPNTEAKSVEFLRRHLGAGAQGIENLGYLVPPMNDDKLQRRREELRADVDVIGLAMDDIQADDIRMLMAATDNASLYMTVLDNIMYQLDMEGKLTVESYLDAIARAEFTPQVKALVEARLVRVRRFLTGKVSIKSKFRSGQLWGVDVRNDWSSKEEAMAIFAILMRNFSLARDADGEEFNKVVIYDEAHKYMNDSAMTRKLIEMMRQMRHQRMWVIVASQDVTSLPKEVNELSTITIVHRVRSKKQHQALIEGNIGWKQVSLEDLAALEQGWAYILVAEATDKGWTLRPYKVLIRPTCAMPGGTTRTAVAEISSAN